MARNLFERIAPYIPRGHWLPFSLVVVVAVTCIYKFSLDAWVKVELSKEPVQEQPQGEQGDALVDDASLADGESRAEEVSQTVAELDQTVAEAPGERMVPEWMVHLLLEALERSEERADKRLARRDEQINGLARQIADLRGQLTDQQQQIVDMHAEQVEQAWNEAKRIRREALSAPTRSNSISIVEQHGPQATPRAPSRNVNVFGSPRGASQPGDDPFASDPFASDNLSPVVSPRTVPSSEKSRPKYLNVSPRRSSGSNGIPAGSSGARIENAAKRHRAAVDFGRGYNSRTATSRLLGELEKGNR